jgi:Ser/Thr protein kinase RdoA (MazF antagonist)
MDQELRVNVEKAVSVYIRDAYALTGDASTVVKGANWTIAIVDGEQTVAFVRLYRTSGRSQADAASELAVLRAVQDTPALEVSRPFADRWGRTLSEVELPDGTQRLIAVFAPALGRELTATAADYRHAGAALSDLHRQSELTRLAPQREFVSELADKQTLAMIANRSNSAADGIIEALDALKDLGANKLIGPVGLCHGDVRLANMRIDGERVTMFDFDDCGRGPQWLDVAAMAFWLEVLPCDHPGALWRAFLDGYGLPESEALALFVRWLVANHQLRITRFLFDYCELDAALWDHALSQARSVVWTAAHGDLRAFALP